MSCCCPQSDDYDEVRSKVSAPGALRTEAPVKQSIDRYTVSLEVNDEQVEAVGATWKQGTPRTPATEATADESFKIIACDRQISDLTFGENPALRIVRDSFDEPCRPIRRPETDHPELHPEQQFAMGCIPVQAPLKRPGVDNPEEKPGEYSLDRESSILDAKEGFERFDAVSPAPETSFPTIHPLNSSQDYLEEDALSEDELSKVIPIPQRTNSDRPNHVEEARLGVQRGESPQPSGMTSMEPEVSHVEASKVRRLDFLPPIQCAMQSSPPSPPAPPKPIPRRQDSEWAAAAIKASQIPNPQLVRTVTTEDPPPPPPVQSPSVSPIMMEEKKSADPYDDYETKQNFADTSNALVEWDEDDYGYGDDEDTSTWSYQEHSTTISASTRSQTDRRTAKAESDVFSDRQTDVAILEDDQMIGRSDAPSPSDIMLSEFGAWKPPTRRAYSGNDALSDVPSDVDPASRQRYLAACRLLKNTLIEKKQDISSSDLRFFQDLLGAENEGRAPSHAEMEAMESASEALRHNESSVDLRKALMKAKHQMTADIATSLDPANPTPLGRHASLGDSALPSQPIAAPQKPRRVQLRQEKKQNSFDIIGKYSADPGVLTPPIMDGIRQFLPRNVKNEYPNFFLKYSSDQESNSLAGVLPKIENSTHTIIGVETTQGDVFGAFCSSPWKVGSEWFGSRDSFLWRLSKSRVREGQENERSYNFDNELEIYQHAGSDDMIQYCTNQTLAVGGGDWRGFKNPSNEPLGIGLMIDGDMMGGETNLCSTFANPRLSGENSSGTEFEVVTLEIWSLTPFTTVEKAEEGEKLEGLTGFFSP